MEKYIEKTPWDVKVGDKINFDTYIYTVKSITKRWDVIAQIFYWCFEKEEGYGPRLCYYDKDNTRSLERVTVLTDEYARFLYRYRWPDVPRRKIKKG